MAEFTMVTEAAFAKKKRPATAAFRAESATFDARTKRLIVQLSNGVEAAFPVGMIKGLEDAAPEDLRTFEVQGRGFGLHAPQIDADISVSQLFEDLLGSTVMAKSERRLAASRSNGAKGGRPKSGERKSA
ncbi:MAG: DUF2442 domain-containing protein [Asticcacaulis sp.]|uniref:DUF2442 domain-containing protein n=1 Tax=Asticcacaulis sp. TaxID=1872648 RepID=UPI003F7CB657